MYTYGRQSFQRLTTLTLAIIIVLCLPVYTLDDGSHYTNFWVVDFKPELSEAEINQIAQSYGFLNYGKLFEDLNLYELHHPRVVKRSLDHAHDYTNILENHAHIVSAGQQIGKIRVKRGRIPLEPHISMRDPLWPKTWYLNRGVNSRTFYDMNVIPAWKRGFTGKNVVVTILDDGIEHDHPDLLKNYDKHASTDINNKDDDPEPRYDYSNENRHGTRCAGEVAAEANNTFCSIGVAYDAFIGGIRMLDGSVTDSVEAQSLKFNLNHVDIYSSSWGPDDNGRVVDGPGPLAKKSFIDGVTKGRHGKGNIFLWASGNGGLHFDSCSCDGYTNSIYTLSVSSASESNSPPWYLEQCASTLATTYSSGTSNRQEKQIVTTDLRKSCTTSHTGTSASAPLAAGLVAVMLEANQEMTWRDVQYVTMAAANPEPLLSKGAFKTNGVGRKYSHKFGYGLMDCGKMVELAQGWKQAPLQLIKHLPKFSPDANLKTTYSSKIKVHGCSAHDMGCINYLEHVQLVLTMSSSRRGRLTVKLRSPLGTESTVLPVRSSDSSSTGFEKWPFMSVHFWGENPAGTWEFEIRNEGQSGKLTSYQLVIYGVAIDPFDSNRAGSGDKIVCDKSCGNSTDSSLACSGSGPDQCKQCKTDLFRVEDTNMCVASCDKGYYKDGEAKECKLCHKSCATCSAGKEESCTSCDSELLLDSEGHCVEQCPTGCYPEEAANLCKLCKENCTSCASLDQCLDCGSGFEVVKGQCKLLCREREYRNKDEKCVSCTDEHCVLCQDADTCEGCDVNYNLYHDQCVEECPNTTYVMREGRDSGQNECFDCHDDCATCNEGMDNNCLSCLDRYQITPSHKCVENATCQFGQFRALNVGDCEDCHASCDTCQGSSSLDCTSCPNKTYLKNGACVGDCGVGLYPYINEQDKHASCQHCHPSCLSCNDEQKGNCTSCPEDTNPEDGECHPLCPSGEYLKPFQTSEKDVIPCANCSTDCLTCSGPRDSDCRSCVEDRALAKDGSCVMECDRGYFKKDLSMEGMETNFICHVCNRHCLTCQGELLSDCLTCPDEHIIFQGLCVEKSICYDKQYYNSTANECLSCHSLCVDCIGPSELECTSCEAPRKLYVKPDQDMATNDQSAASQEEPNAGQCVMCCDSHKIDSGICCDCSEAGPPLCDEGKGVDFTTEELTQRVTKEHRNFIVFVILGILGSVLLYFVVFLLLQYRSHGRCVWQTSSSTLLVDGSGVIEYSALADKDQDTLFVADDGYQGFSKVSNSSSKQMFDYGSD